MAEIDKKYHKLLNKILVKGTRYEDSNRKGVYRIQIPSYTIKHNFKNGFPAITTKKLYWKGVVGELLWFLRGETNIKYLVDNNINIWNKDAYNEYSKQLKKRGGHINDINTYISQIKSHGKIVDHGFQYGNLGKVYGAQWRKWCGNKEVKGSSAAYIDQISNLIKGLKENPMGTRHIVTAWNPAELDDMALPPCHWSFEILVEPLSWHQRIDILRELPEHLNAKYKHARLDEYNIPKCQFTLKWHQRSVDTFLGLPFNIASYALLSQIIGKMTNMKPKGIIGDLSNVHIYEPHLDAVKKQLDRNIDKHGKCELELHPEFDIATNAFNQKILNLDEYISELRINMFELKDYSSYPRIPAEMLAYNK